MSEYIKREDAVKALRTIRKCVKLFEDSIEDAAVALNDLAQSADVVERPSWIPVEERLPEKNTWVLAYCKYKDHVIDYVDIHGLWSYGNVTHWMPPPEPPKEEA